MTTPATTQHTAHSAGSLLDIPLGLVLAATRRSLARRVADLAGAGPGDRVLDIGCGPGNAVREAARRGATATGVDPSPGMLRLARLFSRRAQAAGQVSFVPGAAEALPLPDGAATVAWTVSAYHHWSDQAAGLREARRVLAPGGRFLLIEQLATRERSWRARHGLTAERAEGVAAQLRGAGFERVRVTVTPLGRARYAVVQGEAPAA